jgi:thioredoxin reductase (NADPH)
VEGQAGQALGAGALNAPVEAPAAAGAAVDAVVIGAGPVGLFQVFELGLLDIRAHVIDTLEQPGGQCIELYPDKPIYDIPGLPRCTGRELVERLMQQARPFEPVFHLGQQVAALRRQADGRFLVQTSRGQRLMARAVVIAAGVGAFQPRTLKLEGLERFEGTQVLYRASDPTQWAGRHVLVVGGEDAALEAALAAAQDGPHRAASVTLVHRRDVFNAAPPTLTRVQALRAEGRIAFIAGQITGVVEAGGRLNAVQVGCSDGTDRTVALDRLLVCLGLSPKLGPIADWGLAMQRKQLVVDTEAFETSEPGIFAVGDINTYPGKKKLIVCGFHEATLAAFGVSARLFPDHQAPLQYTTSSPRLHRLLGVDMPAAG